MPFRLGAGIAKPSYYINMFHGYPYCFHNNLTLSIQQQIRWVNIEMRFDILIGDSYWGWFTMPLYCNFGLGINHSFDLKRKSKKPHKF